MPDEGPPKWEEFHNINRQKTIFFGFWRRKAADNVSFYCLLYLGKLFASSIEGAFSSKRVSVQILIWFQRSIISNRQSVIIDYINEWIHWGKTGIQFIIQNNCKLISSNVGNVKIVRAKDIVDVGDESMGLQRCIPTGDKTREIWARKIREGRGRKEKSKVKM